ncbi:MAG: FHA domain-containing protein [Pyrinomonadaceae bacterium]|nr:FHA domain-containing protein [Pyrinomonadaceae bacterium]
MKKVTLKIETRDQSQTIELDDEISIGRTASASLVLDDVGLSRVNTTFFRDGESVLVVDEGSLNGTFLNGEKLGSKPVKVFDGDRLKLGTETTIQVEFEQTKAKSPAAIETPVSAPVVSAPAAAAPARTVSKPPLLIIGAVISSFLIVFLALITIVIVRAYKNPENPATGKNIPVNSGSDIPIRVIDPLGGGDSGDIADIMSYWDVQEEELNTADVAAVTAEPSSISKINLNVSLEFFTKQMERSKASRGSSPTGNDPPGTIVPPELRQGFAAQTAKIRELQANGYKIPLDFADLAEKRIAGKLVELPMATEDFVLDVGGSSTGDEFTNFSFDTNPRSQKIAPGSIDFNILNQLASNFDGQRYSLDDANNRRQMKIRLLRMFHPSAMPILTKLAKDYREKFGYPLRVTSLSRSMEYQISLNKGNPNSYVVKGAGSLPPHTSGCTFDLSRKFMTAEEQNYLMFQLAAMEKEGIVDALREGNVNACFHVFILRGCEA